MERSSVDARVVVICAWSIVLAVVTGFVAQALVGLIGLVTNIAFYGRFSTAFVSPAGNRLGWLVVLVPAVGGLVVGIMARFESKAIRGHGIPEAMEQVLLNESRIPARVMLLKPLSAAISIGTGGPFGAEGPIIATGGAMGSVLGQIMKTTAMERKTLLAAGAAAGMAATFGSPVAAVLLAVELLLFEFRPRSIIPVALASAAATDVVVGAIGTFAPRTLGVGYDNIEDMVSGKLFGGTVLFLCVMKFLSWSISLGIITRSDLLAAHEARLAGEETS